jgi:hypothetical protein
MNGFSCGGPRILSAPEHREKAGIPVEIPVRPTCANREQNKQKDMRSLP